MRYGQVVVVSPCQRVSAHAQCGFAARSMVDYQLTQVKVKKYIHDEQMRCQQAQLNDLGQLREAGYNGTPSTI